MAARRYLRPLAASLAIISVVMPWYMRVDPGPPLALLNFLLSWEQITSIQVAAGVFVIGAVISLFAEAGINILALGYVSTVLVMEDYRVLGLGQDLQWGIGFYLAMAAMMICALDTILLVRERHATKALSSALISGQEEN